MRRASIWGWVWPCPFIIILNLNSGWRVSLSLIVCYVSLLAKSSETTYLITLTSTFDIALASVFNLIYITFWKVQYFLRYKSKINPPNFGKIARVTIRLRICVKLLRSHITLTVLILTHPEWRNDWNSVLIATCEAKSASPTRLRGLYSSSPQLIIKNSQEWIKIRIGVADGGEGGGRPPPQTSLIRAKITQYSGNVWIFTPGNIQFSS